MARILVVDDEHGIRELLSEILQDEGHSVVCAENAAQAQAFVRGHVYDLVLLDIWMPDIDGISLLKDWKAQPEIISLEHTGVVIMSGHASIETAQDAKQLGALGFLEKPIAMGKLLQTVTASLRQVMFARHAAKARALSQSKHKASPESTRARTGDAAFQKSKDGIESKAEAKSFDDNKVARAPVSGSGSAARVASSGRSAAEGSPSKLSTAKALIAKNTPAALKTIFGAKLLPTPFASKPSSFHSDGTDSSFEDSKMDMHKLSFKMSALPGEPAAASIFPDSLIDMPLREARDAFEKIYLEYCLAMADGSMTRVSEQTGLERTNLYRKIKALGVDISKMRIKLPEEVH